MRLVTNLMDKIFSDSTPDEFKAAVSDKIAEAKDNGSAELKDGENHLKFSEKDGEVIIDDKVNNEKTKATEDGDEIKLTGVPETKLKSATQPEVVVPVPAGETTKAEKEDSTLPDVKVSIKEAIVDGDKAGMNKSYSLVFEGLSSYDEAEALYSDLQDAVAEKEAKEENNGVNFSDEEMQEVAEKATEAKETHERMMGTGDEQLAYSLIEQSEELKAYSALAINRGFDLSDVYEAACTFSEDADNLLTQIYSEMDINEYFSELDEDEISAYFSDLDEVEADVLYSALADDENYTFSEVEEVCNEIYSELELETPVDEFFSELSEDEIDAIFSELTDQEANVLYSALMDEDEVYTFSDVNEAFEELNQMYSTLDQPVDEFFSELSEDEINSIFSELTDQEANVLYSALTSEDEVYTFSDVNEAFEELNTPLDQIFSDMTEDQLACYADTVGEDIAEVAFSLASDEDEVYTFSDLLDVVEYMTTFSDEDAQQVSENLENIGKAAEDMKKSNDPELAKKVKVLADATAEDIEKAKEAGYETEKAKEMCARYSEDAAKVLDNNGINPESVDKDKVMESIQNQETKAASDDDDENKKEIKVAEPKSSEEVKQMSDATYHSTFFGQRNFANTLEKETSKVFSTSSNTVTTSNSCLTSKIN